MVYIKLEIELVDMINYYHATSSHPSLKYVKVISLFMVQLE